MEIFQRYIDQEEFRYIAREGDEFYWGTADRATAESKNSVKVDLRNKLDPADIFPKMERGTLKYKGDMNDPTIFIKTNELVRHLPAFSKENNLPYYRSFASAEIIACEKIHKSLGSSKRPNLASYRGVIVDGADHVIAIAYDRYDCTLWDARYKHQMLSLRTPANETRIIDSVRNGMTYLHNQKLVHCDIRPENIFLKINGQSVQVILGDFDAVKEIGTLLCGKKAPSRIWPKEHPRGSQVVVAMDEKLLGKLPDWFTEWRKEKVDQPS